MLGVDQLVLQSSPNELNASSNTGLHFAAVPFKNKKVGKLAGCQDSLEGIMGVGSPTTPKKHCEDLLIFFPPHFLLPVLRKLLKASFAYFAV